ncbi:hypothetical protein QO034_03035 [Sedimentitalea sp. JM2-8]|uniref:Uncharacterized protein n=1 Tax=Sedimentitalea xiamensis TaxID=3050037 RepID=A0ABT7FAD0_9RHOB|nr:hypothetical protein [Sedimentitalea xiamensis]MDK3072073.1 hypothetical protein [Sedimentitalea xiamensis]
MSTYISDDVRCEITAARLASLKKLSRLRVRAGQEVYTILRMWRGGFSVEADTVPPLRGLVDLYDGERHLCQCLIIGSEPEAGERRYEFKRNTAATETAPLDHYREPGAPAGLLPRF